MFLPTKRTHTQTRNTRTLLLARLFYLSKNQRKTICNLFFKHSLAQSIGYLYMCVSGINSPIVQCARSQKYALVLNSSLTDWRADGRGRAVIALVVVCTFFIYYLF